MLKIVGIVLALGTAILAQGAPKVQEVCNMRCDDVYNPVCIKDAESRVQEFTNYCHLRQYNCKHKLALTPNTQCPIHRFRKILEERIWHLQRYYGNQHYPSYQNLHTRRFVDAFRDLIKHY